MTDPIPSVDFAIVCGSANWGLRFPEDLQEPGVAVLQRDMVFETPWGDTGDWKLVEIDGTLTADGAARRVLVVWSHGWPLDRIDHEAQRRVFWVLQEAGVRKVLCSSTAGALARGILKGDFTIASDILEMTQTEAFPPAGPRRPTTAAASRWCARHARRPWRRPRDRCGRPGAGSTARRPHLVAGHAWGPRLTSPAEARAHRMLGADITNHSLVPEATLAREIGACFVNCTFITVAFDDYFAPADQRIIGGGAARRPVARRVPRGAAVGRPPPTRPRPASAPVSARRRTPPTATGADAATDETAPDPAVREGAPPRPRTPTRSNPQGRHFHGP